MTTCGSLQHIFDNLWPENPTLLESLKWNQIKPIKSIEQNSSFTEIFGELHFKESPISSISSSPSSSHVSTISSSIEIPIKDTKLNQNEDSGSSDTNQTPSSASFSSTPMTSQTIRHKSSGSFSWLSSESLHLCTEGLGFESSDDVEDSKSGMSEYWPTQNEKEGVKEHLSSRVSFGECRRSRASGGEYPPPISCIGRTGKPFVCFRSYRSNGRFVLKEVRVPTQEFLRAYREDGRLKLQFVHPDEEFLEEEDEEEGKQEEGDDDIGSIEEKEENIEKEYDDCVNDDIGSIEEKEENIEKEYDDCVTHHAYEEKEIDGQVTSYSVDERQEI